MVERYFPFDQISSMGIVILLLLLLSVTSHGAEFPEKWTACKKSSTGTNECLKTAINFAIHDLVAGNPSLGVLPLDPMHFDSLTINQGTGPVSINLEYSDMDVTGIKDLQVHKVVTDWKTMELQYSIPTKLILQGKYKINGQILMLPISGDGPFMLSMDNFKAVAKLKFGEKNDGGKTHYTVKSFSFTFDIDNMIMKFDNLFNGAKTLGDNMNLFLNANWQEIMKELKPAISRAFSAAYKEVGNRVFSRLEKEIVSPP